MSHHALKSI